MEILHSKKFIEIRLHKEYKCIEWEWKQPATIKDTKKLLDKIHDFFVKNNCDKINNIMQNMGVLPPELQEFVNTSWMPRMAQAGLKYVALVIPKSASADYTVEKVRDQVADQREKGGIEEAAFGTIEEARAWIASR